MTSTTTNGVRSPLALTMGEPAGIGGEITLKAWLRRSDNGIPPFAVIDDPERLQRIAGAIEIPVTVRAVSSVEEAAATFSSALPVLPLSLAADPVPGKPDPANAAAVRSSIEEAMALVAAGSASAVVTNPVHKETLYAAGFPFPGHTEFLAELTGASRPPAMMLVCDALRTVPVSVHVSLKEAIQALTVEQIVEKAMITEAALRTDFAVAKPRLAVAGLNPHAGEGGSLGTEDADIVAAAVVALCQHGINAFGPVAADSLFGDRARAGYDAALCMYHDQALIPVKTLDFDGAVNVTLGLPVVRASPDHGTALDIAGTGAASEASLVAALKLAAAMASRRATNGQG